MPDDPRTLVQGAARIIEAGIHDRVAGRPAESRTWQRLAGRTALVVGAARGMGEATARLFHAEGAKVVLGDVLDAQGELVAKELGEGALYVHLDVTSETDWTHAHDTAEAEFGAPVTAYAHTAAVASSRSSPTWRLPTTARPSTSTRWVSSWASGHASSR